MKICIATDHAGFEMKEKLLVYLQNEGHTVEDFGASSYDSSDDYPDFIAKAAQAVSEAAGSGGGGVRGIILGGSGQGEAMVANRFFGVRATVYYGGKIEIISLSREHNDANMLSLGARFLSDEEALEAVKVWLDADFSGDERHVRRIQKMDRLER
jgi:ribose 5-phosphate isomerase B